jgi:FMN phosphatase YigB (HAD superfamily)
MFTNPTSIATIVTLITAVLARKFITPDDVESGTLVKSMDGVKSALSKIEDSIKDKINISKISNKVTGTIQNSVTKSPDFSKITNLVKEVNLDKLDIDALKKLSNKIVKIEGDAYEFVDTEVSDTKITMKIVDIFKNVKIKVFDGVDKITVKLSKALPKDIEVNVEPKLINEAVATFENGKVKLTTVSEETIKNLISSNDLASALDIIKLNLSTIVAKQLFDALEKADGNIVKISPDEGIAYLGGKFYDVFYKDGNIVKMEVIDSTVALAKLEKFAEDVVGNFITLNKDIIKQLLKNNGNLQSIEYELTNKLTSNVVRNEYLKLKDTLGNETTLTSKTMINPNKIETLNEITGKNLPEISKNSGFLTPQQVDDLLTFDNDFSQIFKQLIDEHPEVKELLEKLASKGKLPASFRQLKEIAGKIESFYEALDNEVKDIENKLSSDSLFNGVDINSIVKKIVEKLVVNNPDDVLDGKVPKISLSDILDHLSTSDKAKIVLNYLKTDPEVYDEVMNKLSNFSADTRDYILAQAYDQIEIALKNNIPITADGLDDVVADIDDAIQKINSKKISSAKSQTSVSSSTTSSTSNTGTSTTGAGGSVSNTSANGTSTPGGSVSNANVSTSSSSSTTSSTSNTGTSTTGAGGTVSNTSANGTSAVLQPPVQPQGILKKVSLNVPLENMLSSLFPDFDKLPSAVKTLFEDVVFRQLKESGELTKEDIMKALEDAKAEYQAILDSIRKLVDDVKAETTSAKEEESVMETLDTNIGELEKKVQFDLKRLSYFLSMVSFIADKFNVATAIEFLNQLNSLTPQQLQRTIILTQPQLETIAKIAPLLKELIVKLDNGAKLKDLQDLVVKIREALEKAEINLDVEELIKIINVVQTMTKEFNLKTSEIATLITENDVNNLRVIPVPVISNLNLKSLIIPTTTQPGNNRIPVDDTIPNTEEIPETSVSVGEIPLEGEALQQLQQLLQEPTATPPSIPTSEEGGNQGGGITVPPSYSNQQFASYKSRQQYLII